MVEITPKKSKLVLPSWRWPLWLSFTLFFLSILIYIGVKVYLAQIQSEIISINEQIKAEISKVNIEDENTIVRLSYSLAAFGNIVSNHSYFSDFFNLIGSLSHSKIVFTKFDASRDKSVIVLRGLAQNYTILAKQMVALRENNYIKSLEIKEINFGSAGLDFELTLGIDPAIFIKK